MITNNNEFFAKTNIDKWHAAGWTGKGMRVAVWDGKPMIYSFMDGYASIPCDEVFRDPTAAEMKANNLTGHGTQVARVLHEVAPDAEIFMLWATNASPTTLIRNAQWIVDNNIDVVVSACSGMSTGASDLTASQLIIDAKIPWFTAAGNYGVKAFDVGQFGKNFGSLSIGSAYINTDTRAADSSVGEHLTCLAYERVYYQATADTISAFDGTSCAAPFAAGMGVLYGQYIKQVFSEYEQDEALEWIKMCCYDKGEPGWDKMTGYGLLHLPAAVPPKNKEVDMEIEMTIGSNVATKNGEPVQLLAAPFVKDGRTYLPVRDIGNLFGCRVDYDNKTKKITITK